MTTATPHPVIPGYQIREQLYAGSRTLVYRAIREQDKLAVVIKFLTSEYPSFNELLQFRNQYTITKNLNIPGIIHPLSLEAYGNGYILVMEDAREMSLQEYIKIHSLSLREFLAIAIQLADILHHLYQNRVIHKDIKPGNILIHPETKKVKLIDFSIASLLPRETQEIKSPNILEGTLAYLSPEQTGRMNRGIDYRSDFYSLGVTFFEILTGQLPFISDDPMELVYCHIAQKAVSVSILRPEVPEVIGEIIHKLMGKNAENRYRSALGIKHDLETCLHQLKNNGEIRYFEIAQQDICDKFLILEKLYGRATEVEELLAAFERVSKGNRELILVAGFSGIGKTAVISSVYKPIVKQSGYFIKGKFDQFNRNVPLDAFVQAFRGLVWQVLSENDTQLSIYKNKILETVGVQGQVIIDVIPELEEIIGKQPPVPKLSGTAAQNRFNLLFGKFIQVFTTFEHPLVIFLDDLQWADLASLNLMKLLMSEAESSYLLIIGAYRDNEVFPAHPLILTLNEIHKKDIKVNTITLTPLSKHDINHLVADTLSCDRELAKPLAELVYQKTKGNPFFTTQFLMGLYRGGWISFNIKVGYWECDITRVRQLALTDDVVKFMASQLQKLPETTQEVLKLAACLGNQFDLATLAIASKQSDSDTANSLWQALQFGLILPRSQVYKFFQEPELNQTHSSVVPSVAYRFLHDRVQQAAYSLIPENSKQTTRLKIGQLLLKNTSEKELSQKIFDIVNQLNYGVDLLTTNNQRKELARLNLIAGCKAKSSTAYNVAVEYLEKASKLLGIDSWVVSYDLIVAIQIELLEAEYLSAKFHRANSRAEEIILQLQSVIEKVKVYEIQIQFYIVQAQEKIAIAKAKTALEMLGINLPDRPSEIISATEELQLALTQEVKNVDSLINLPEISDPGKLAAMVILSNVAPATLHADPLLLPLVVLKMVTIAIRSGNCPQAAFAYAWYGALSCGKYLNFDLGYQFGKLALKVLNILYAPEMEVKVINLFNVFVRHWQEPLRAALNPLKDSIQSGIETGNIEFSFYNVLQYCSYLFFSGEQLEFVKSQQETYLLAIKQFHLELHGYVHQIWMQLVVNLCGESDLYREIIIYNSDGEDLLSIWQKKHNFQLCFYLHCSRTINLYFHNNYDQAVKSAVEGEKYTQSVTAMVYAVEHNFYYSLALSAQINQLVDPTHKNHLKQIEINQKKMELWATCAPMNFQHKYDLIEAEKYRIIGNKTEAIEHYDKAISGAKVNKYIHEEALGKELAAKFYLQWGKEKIAQVYMQEAYYCYAHWGAKAKTNDLEQRYPNLLRPILQQAAQTLNPLEILATIAAPNIFIHTSPKTNRYSHATINTNINTTLDFAAILKALRAISGTIELSELICQLTQIILHNSGGDRCALILPNSDGKWQVEAVATPETTELLSTPLKGNTNLPLHLIQYVKHTKEVVVIDNLKTNLPVIDEYLTKQRPKSVLCLPILNQGNLIGILYLKNSSVSGVFTRDRILILNFLCTQAAISLENGRLYQQTQQALQMIQRQEAQYRGIFETVSEGLAIINLETEMLVAANPVYCQMHGYSYEELLKLKPSELLRPKAYAKFLGFLNTVQQGEKFSCEAVCFKKDGTQFNAEMHSVPFWYDGKLCGLTTLRDVTERTHLQQAIQEKNQTLEQTLKELQQAQMQVVQSEKMSALGNLVAGVAHEINNPIGFLNGSIDNTKEYIHDLLGHLELYQQHHPHVADKVQDNAEDIDLEYLCDDLPKLLDSMQGATDRIQSISTSLRSFSRADTDRKVMANLHEGLDSTLLILKYRLKGNENRPAININKEYAAELPEIECFPGQLNQVFMNILANGIDMFDEIAQTHTFADIRANPQEITIRTEVRENQVYIWIRDNGKGMSQDVQAKIFNHLFTTKSVGKGTGLGLAIAQAIVVEKHGGSLEVQSELDRGSEFCIQLPIINPSF